MLYSFDVFETLMTRTTATPSGIFALLQDRLCQDAAYADISQYIKDNYFHLRIHAEILARRSFEAKHVEEVSLQQIYDVLKLTGCLCDEAVERLMSLEKQLEYENCVPIDQNIEKVKLLISEGKKVVLISDMYLDQHTIRRMLVKLDAVFAGVPLYVSSEYGVKKTSGGLFHVVQKQELVEFSEWLHCGDNIYADLKPAKYLGISCEYAPFEALLDWEINLLKNREDDVLVQFIIGTARNVRLQGAQSSAERIGISIGGPILYSYVNWILNESCKKGIRRLYFIARDGFVLKQIAEILIQQFQLNIETYYIYGSRKAWRMPSFSKNNCNLMRFIGWSHAYNIKSVQDFANILKIDAEDLFRFLPDRYKDCRKSLSYLEVFLLTMRLNQDKMFIKFLCDVHKNSKVDVIGYLKQNIDISDNDFAFVELAGGGFTQGCLAEIMCDFFHGKIQTFFFKMDRAHAINNNVCYVFFPSFVEKNLTIEMLSRAPHGQTESYVKDEAGIYKPILKQGEEKALLEHGFNAYSEGVRKFCHEYSKRRCLGNIKIDVILSYINQITNTSNEEILTFFGNMPNDFTGREKQVVEYAPKLSRNQLRIYGLYNPEVLEDFYLGSDFEYSLLRCSLKDRKKVLYYQRKSGIILSRYKRLYKKAYYLEKTAIELSNAIPYDLLKKRVVIYGAGVFGKIISDCIHEFGQSEIVQWIDQNYQKYRTEGYPVDPIAEFGKYEYDHVIIAIKDRMVARTVRDELVRKGAPREKIIGVNMIVEWV